MKEQEFFEYDVEVVQTAYATHVFRVRARDFGEAKEQAMRVAPNFKFSTHKSVYHTESVSGPMPLTPNTSYVELMS